MKKLWLVPVLMLVTFGLIFTGCPEAGIATQKEFKGKLYPADYEKSGATIIPDTDNSSDPARMIFGTDFNRIKAAEKDANNNPGYLVANYDTTDGGHNGNTAWGFGKINNAIDMNYKATATGSDMYWLISDLLETCKGSYADKLDFNAWYGVEDNISDWTFEIWVAK